MISVKLDFFVVGITWGLLAAKKLIKHFLFNDLIHFQILSDNLIGLGRSSIKNSAGILSKIFFIKSNKMSSIVLTINGCKASAAGLQF